MFKKRLYLKILKIDLFQIIQKFHMVDKKNAISQPIFKMELLAQGGQKGGGKQFYIDLQ